MLEVHDDNNIEARVGKARVAGRLGSLGREGALGAAATRQTSQSEAGARSIAACSGLQRCQPWQASSARSKSNLDLHPHAPSASKLVHLHRSLPSTIFVQACGEAVLDGQEKTYAWPSACVHRPLASRCETLLQPPVPADYKRQPRRAPAAGGIGHVMMIQYAPATDRDAVPRPASQP